MFLMALLSPVTAWTPPCPPSFTFLLSVKQILVCLQLFADKWILDTILIFMHTFKYKDLGFLKKKAVDLVL
jgi:hypothetical protein